MQKTAANINSTGAGGEIEHDQLAELVDAAMKDRSLRQSAFTVGLGRKHLLDFVATLPPKFDAVGVDQRARIERTKREISLAEERLEEVEHRNSRLRRWVAVTTVLAWLALIGAGLFFSISGMSTALGFLLIAGLPSALIAAWVVLSWPPSRLVKRSARLKGEIKNSEAVGTRAEAELKSVLVEEAIRPSLRTYVNSQAAAEHRTKLTLTEQEGLAELEDPRYAIPTVAREQLDGFLKEMPGGSIGLAGPRGVGKTTIIRSVCPTVEGGTEQRFGLVVAAPVDFDPREFLLYLFAETCRAIIGSSGVAELRRADPVERLIPRSALRFLLPVSTLLLAVAGAASIFGTIFGVSHVAEVTLGVVLIVVAFGMAARLRVRSADVLIGEQFSVFERGRLTGFPESLVEEAADRLKGIWYQQTFTSGWSGTLRAPVGDVGLQGSRELARQQMTLPDIVGEFRGLLAAVAEHRQVLVGIDELDKIDSRDDAYRFMNELKVLFGVENCFFLLSVSEDAMSAFERRGLPFRDVFDSSFDDVVNVGFLNAKESVALIQRRVIGMPLPFIYLCHCVAGGLARDVIRVAREVVVSNPKGEEGWALHEACRTIVATDAKAKIEAGLVATRAMSGGRDVETLRSWLQRMRSVSIDPDALLEACARGHDDPLGRLVVDGQGDVAEPGGSPRALACELLTFMLYAATLMEFFDSSGSPDRYVDARDSGRLDQLAQARQALSVHPRVAWECLADFREVVTPPFPVAA